MPARWSGPRRSAVVREALEALVLMLSPFAPHTAEELWCMLGYAGRASTGASWPVFDAEVAKADEIIDTGAGERQGARPADRAGGDVGVGARSDWRSPIRRCRRTLAGKTVKKVVVAKGRLVSIVVR